MPIAIRRRDGGFASSGRGEAVQTLLGRARRRRARSACRDLVESAAAAMFSVDARGRIVVWNREMEGLTGLFAREARSRNLRDLVRPEENGAADDLLTAAAFPQSRRRLRARLTGAGGERRVTLSRGALAGGGYAFVVVDLRERRQPEPGAREREERLNLALADEGRLRGNAPGVAASLEPVSVAVLGVPGTPGCKRLPI